MMLSVVNIINDYNAVVKIVQVIASGRAHPLSGWDQLIMDEESTYNAGKITATAEVSKLVLGG